MSTDGKITLRMNAEMVRQLKLRCCHADIRVDDLVAALVLTHLNQRDPSDFGKGLLAAYQNWVGGNKHRIRPWPEELLQAARRKLSAQQQPTKKPEGDQPAKKRRRPAAERTAAKSSPRIEAMKANGLRQNDGSIQTPHLPR
ncbi:hypothetical protein Plim_0994 [Planctopirus limnophila DSM 3776]|uniref:Uncharacterized protein n=1 Tax=Planctopirus limnophila (strain ATCC 43296 / DSM 3776 / IFAM 1008 / Mu 290) TaxID=521674 RepID=D5ST69_PLAL2|nr:hypothetical protein [Planctopirus limnophila]ADG66837.1 hypothetical protein Plim_0994 [Planctopirus limnophila DSM 3776]